MDTNPFKKESFSTHREWEESLVTFMADEVMAADVAHWTVLAVDRESKISASFTAAMLSNLVETKPDFCRNAKSIFAAYDELKVNGGGADMFDEWLRSGWLNVSRVAGMLHAELKTRENGRLSPTPANGLTANG